LADQRSYCTPADSHNLRRAHAVASSAICHTWRSPSFTSIVQPLHPVSLSFFRSRMICRASSRAAPSSAARFPRGRHANGCCGPRIDERHAPRNVTARIYFVGPIPSTAFKRQAKHGDIARDGLLRGLGIGAARRLDHGVRNRPAVRVVIPTRRQLLVVVLID
jgi:hypothetical protein